MKEIINEDYASSISSRVYGGKMKEIINEDYASSIGFEYFDVHDTWFVMAAS